MRRAEGVVSLRTGTFAEGILDPDGQLSGRDNLPNLEIRLQTRRGKKPGQARRVGHRFGVRGHVRALKAVRRLPDRRTPKYSRQFMSKRVSFKSVPSFVPAFLF